MPAITFTKVLRLEGKPVKSATQATTIAINARCIDWPNPATRVKAKRGIKATIRDVTQILTHRGAGIFLRM
jgi:hypothetical protein